MKTVFLSLLLACSLSLTAQDFTYNGPAESAVKSFWTNAMGIPKTRKYAEGVAVLEAKLEEVKKKDPAYDIAKMQAEIAKWKAKAGTPGTEKKDDPAAMNDTQKGIKADKLLRKLFDETPISVTARDLPVIKFRFDEYTGYLKQYEELNFKPRDSDIRRTKAIIEKHIYATNQEIGRIEKTNGTNTDATDAEVNFYAARYNQLYWEAAVKLFPEESSYADELKLVNGLVSKNGSLDKLKADNDKNNAAVINARRLPQAQAHDTKLEKLLIDGFNARFSASQKAKALKAVLTSSGWTIQRNSVTGVITGRERTAKLAYKGADGKCYLLPDYVFIHEDYNGSTYTNTKAVFNGVDGSEMRCENVN